MKVVLEYGAVKLEQHANGEFHVTYGEQVGYGLSYRDAAREFGECLMHQAACDGALLQVEEDQ